MKEAKGTIGHAWPPQPATGHDWREAAGLSLPVLLTVLAIWLPFGFAMTAVIEGWSVLGFFNIDHPFFLASIHSPMQAQALRPLTIFPQALAYFLDPDSFFYWHVLLIAALVVKGCASAHLVARVSRSVRWGALMGVLVLLYPADTMQLSFRSIHINWALALLLLGCSLLIEACRRRHRLSAYLLGASAGLALFLACCMYEASLPLVVAPLLLAYAAFGLKGAIAHLRANLAPLLLWLAGAAAYAGYVALTAPQIASYETALLGRQSAFSILLNSFPKLFSIGASRALLGGWFDAFRMVATEFRTYPYLLLATAVITFVTLGVAARLTRSDSLHHPESTGSSLSLASRTAVAGVIMSLAGYAPFLLSAAHLAISQRTFLFASPGAAMAWIGILMFLGKPAKWLAQAVATLLILAGLGAQLVQFHHYVRITQVQQTLLKSIVQNFDGQLHGKTLLVLDGSNQLGQTWMLGLGNLDMALSYLYGHAVAPVQICRMSNAEWQQPDSLSRKGSCEQTASEWILRPASPVTGPGYVAPPRKPDIHLPKDQVVTVTIKPDGSAVVDPALAQYRRELLVSDSVAARRYRNVLLAQPHLMDMFRDRPRYDHFHWDFGKWWSLEIVVRGTGWREPEWNPQGFFHQPGAWKVQDKGALYFDMSPGSGPHVLSGRFNAIVNDAVRRSMAIRLNGVTLPFQWLPGDAFQAEIPAGVLRANDNEIVFQSLSDSKYYGLSAGLVDFDIRPR